MDNINSTTSGYTGGTTTHTSGLTGEGSHLGHSTGHSTGHSAGHSTGSGLTGNTTTGPHSSETANRLDPTVQGSGAGETGLRGNTTGHGVGISTTTSTTTAPHSGNHLAKADPLTDSSLPGPAPHTAGPHKKDWLNKLDPRVDATGTKHKTHTGEHSLDHSTHTGGPAALGGPGVTATADTHNHGTGHRDESKDPLRSDQLGVGNAPPGTQKGALGGFGAAPTLEQGNKHHIGGETSSHVGHGHTGHHTTGTHESTNLPGTSTGNRTTDSHPPAGFNAEDRRGTTSGIHTDPAIHHVPAVGHKTDV